MDELRDAMLKARSLKDQTTQAYPWTGKVNYSLIDSTAKGDPQGFRGLEYYAPGTDENPTPAIPSVEVFDPKAGPTGVMGDLLSHYMSQADPNIHNFRDRILGSMSPEQIDSIHGDYQRDLEAGRIENGDSFHTWLGKQGGDSFFRGYPTGQWSPNDYTEGQKQTYGQMNDYLTKRMHR